MKLSLIPKTRLGKWSLGLMVAFVVLIILFQLLVTFGERGGDTFFSNIRLSLPISIAGISGISSFFAGIFGIIRSRERSILVFISTLIGFFILFFFLGEILFPH